MSDTKRIRLMGHAARTNAAGLCQSTPDEWIVTFAPPTRSTAQNARLWAMLGDVARQVEWYGKKLAPEDWKHVFSSGLRKLNVVPNIDGTGFVALGLSTSKMSKRELGDLMELVSAFGAERGVKWTEPEPVYAE